MRFRITRTVSAQFFRLIILCTCTCNPAGFAQDPAKDVAAVLDGKTVIVIHWGYGNSTPEVRARAIAARLKSVAEDSSIPIDVTPQPTAMTIDIRCGNVVLASVFTGDAQAENTTREALAQKWANSFSVALHEHRERYGWRQTLIQSAIALLAVLCCAVLFSLTGRYLSKITRAVSSFLETRIRSRRLRVASRLSSTLLDTLVRRVILLIRLLLLLLIAVLTIHTLLGVVPATRPFAMEIYGGVVRSARTLVNSLWTNLPAILFLLILAIFTRYLLRGIRYFFTKVAEGAISIEGFRPSWSTVTARLVSIAVIVLAVLVSYPYIPGSQSPAFKGLSLFLGVLLSLGSTGLVANIISGVMLTYMDAFEVGDLVRIGDVTAYVRKMSLLTTRLITRKNEIITIPNSFVLDKHIINYMSRHQGKESVLISTSVGMGYDVPWRQVEAMLLEAASRTECVAKTPAPFVVVLQFDSFSTSYEVNAYLNPGTKFYIGVTELNHNVLDVFNEYGVPIMTPAYWTDPDQPKVVGRDRWYAPPANQEQRPKPPAREYPPSLP